MDEKPNNFKEAALSHIPKSVIDSMSRQTSVRTEGMTGLEAIKANNGADVLPAKQEMPEPKKYMSLAIDGHVIKISVDPTEGAVTMLLYMLAKVWSKDKKIAKILKQFNFHFFDENNIQLYPPIKNGKK